MSNELVKKENMAMSTEVATPRGFEQVDIDEVTMPRVKVMQAMSPELDDPDYDFKKGDLVHNLLMEKVSPVFVPITIWTSRVMFVPRDNQKRLELLGKLGVSDDGSAMMLCRAKTGRIPDESMLGRNSCADCPHAKWDGNTPPSCTTSVNVLALFEGLEMPVVFQFANTNWKYGKKFRDMAMYAGGDLFSKKYKLAVTAEKNDKGSFFVTPVKPAGLPTEEEIKRAENFYNRYYKANISFEEEGFEGAE